MKPLLALLTFALLSATASAVDVGDFLWQGKYFRRARAAMVDADTIRITSAKDGTTSVPWAKAPAALREKLDGERKDAMRVATDRDYLGALAKWRAANGVFRLNGEVMQVTDAGALIVEDRSSVRYFLRGKITQAEGDRLSFEAKKDETYSYTTVLGAPSKINAVVDVELPPELKR